MKVLVLATRYFGIGGAQAYTRMFTRALAEANDDVEVLALLDGDPGDRPGPGRYLGHQGHRSTRWAQLRFVIETLRRGHGHDLIVCSHVAVAPLGMWLHRLFRTSYLVLGHGIELWERLAPWRQGALREAARVVAVSNFTARMLATVQGVPLDRIVVVYPVVDPALLAEAGWATSRVPASPVTLLTVARLSALERYKGCDIVIRALPAVAARAGAVRYIIVGDGDDRPRLEALAKETGVAPWVKFVGHLSGPDLAVQYRGCDIFVMPSVAQRRADGWTGEGFGIAYLEAAAFGRPVVAGSGGGAPEAIEDGVTGFVVDGSKIEAVAETLIRLAVDPELRTRLGEAGRRRVHAHFTFERLRREVCAVVGTVRGAGQRA